MNKYCLKAHLLASAATLLAAASASAQTAAPAAPAASASEVSNLADIIVTAQRRSENLSKTPVAVSVISGEAMAKAQIVSEQDLQASVPGLQVRGTLSSEQLNYTLRGQSVDAFSGARPGVLPYLIPSPIEHHPCAQRRSPMDMMRHG